MPARSTIKNTGPPRTTTEPAWPIATRPTRRPRPTRPPRTRPSRPPRTRLTRQPRPSRSPRPTPSRSKLFFSNIDGAICFFLMGVQVKFFTVNQNVGKSLKCSQLSLNFPWLAVFKILQFKVNYFLLTSVLPLCQYYDRRLTFQKLP